MMLDPSQLLSLHLEEGSELESLKRYSEFASFHKSLCSGSYSHMVKGELYIQLYMYLECMHVYSLCNKGHLYNEGILYCPNWYKCTSEIRTPLY